MFRRLHFHGSLRDFAPEPVEVFAENIWDALDGATRQIPGLRPDPHAGRKRLTVKGFSTVEALKSPTDIVDVHIYPTLSFGKNGGLVQVLVGITLIALAFTPLGAFAIGIGGSATSLGAIAATVGFGMIIGGVMQMISPVPSLNVNNEEKERSRYLSGQGNTVRIGTHIPVLYGKARCGGHILSLNIDAKDVGV